MSSMREKNENRKIHSRGPVTKQEEFKKESRENERGSYE